MTTKVRLVCGVGRSDADYPVYITAVIGVRRKNLWVCPLYRTWKHMLERCYSAKFQARSPTYIGCSVSPEWHSFMAFRGWMLTHDHEGKQLDKDILFPGNKVYGPDSCVFVSRQLNSFMTDCGSLRGEFPIGASWDKSKGKFKALCRNPFTGNGELLGLFTCQKAAHEAWRKRKHQHACAYADQQTDARIAAALRARYAIADT